MISYLSSGVREEFLMNEPRVPVLVRIRASLKRKIEDLADKEHRSMNQQIEFLLERSLSDLKKEEIDPPPKPGGRTKHRRDA
jgi:hypothetical protein